MSPDHRGAAVGRVSELWRFAVKSMAGERLPRVSFDNGGVLGDRAYALLDIGADRIVTARDTRRFPGLLDCRATFVEPPQASAELPAVRIVLPDGRTTTSVDDQANADLSSHFGVDVKLVRAPRDDLSGLDATRPVPKGSLFDTYPLSIITTATLRRLAMLQPTTDFDLRRFRMNVVVDVEAEGFAENAWVGQSLRIGPAHVRVVLPDQRCVMTTLAQSDLPRDPAVLKTLSEHNRLDTGSSSGPCAGVYAVASASATVEVGDTVHRS